MVQTRVYPTFTENSIQVQNRRYLSKDENGEVIEDSDGMIRRVAHNIAQAELNYNASSSFDLQEVEEDFFDLMRSLKFLPNSPTLMNAGRRLQMLSGCFVLPIEDNMESIFGQVRNTAIVHKSGGGTGFSFSRLRPMGDVVGSTGGIASGPVSFISAFDSATDVVKQGGTRRGANMAVLDITHPDIMQFVTAKESGEKLQNFNISVAITEEWMEKVKRGEDYDLINPKTMVHVASLNAKEVFDKICELAWKTGDPGLWFIDRVNATNPNRHLGAIESCNPCGEQELMPYESCNLGSINLVEHFTEQTQSIDWEELRRTCYRVVHFLDNVIDMNEYPMPEIAEMTRSTRRIGVGVMSWADLLIKMRIAYDSERALELAETLMEFIQKEVHLASADLADKRGCYPAWEGSVYSNTQKKMRNTSPVTIAPTGTISIIAGVSGGIEPLFALSYVRNVMDKTILTEGYDPFREEAIERGFYSDELMTKLAEVGSLGNLPKDFDIPSDVLSIYKTSHDVPASWHIRMQAAFQRGTDNSVSKTINMPTNCSILDIAEAYMLAYETGCKGVTVYRDGSKNNQVLSFGTNGHKPENSIPLARPPEVDGKSYKIRTGHGNMYITLNYVGDRILIETLASQGKAGGCDSAQTEAITRLATLCLKNNVDPKEIASQLRGITCCPIWDDGVNVKSGPDAIAIALERFLGSPTSAVPDRSGLLCPDCYIPVVFEAGCPTCHSCGWSKCI